jgi:hypothetical protein
VQPSSAPTFYTPYVACDDGQVVYHVSPPRSPCLLPGESFEYFFSIFCPIMFPVNTTIKVTPAPYAGIVTMTPSFLYFDSTSFDVPQKVTVTFTAGM